MTATEISPGGTSAAKATLESLGYELTGPSHRSTPGTRFQRREDRVDVMVADHLPARLKPQLGLHRAFRVDGGAQVLNRLITVELENGATTVTIAIPDLLGALVLRARHVPHPVRVEMPIDFVPAACPGLKLSGRSWQ